MSNLLYTKERPWANRYRSSLQKIDVSNFLEKFLFLECFWQFFPFSCPRANCSFALLKRATWVIHSRQSIQRATVSDSLTSLFNKERKSYSLQKNEWIVISLFRSQKTSNLIEKPKSKFPTLVRSCVVQQADWYFGKKMGRVTTTGSLIYSQRVVMFNN